MGEHETGGGVKMFKSNLVLDIKPYFNDMINQNNKRKNNQEVTYHGK